MRYTKDYEIKLKNLIVRYSERKQIEAGEHIFNN